MVTDARESSRNYKVPSVDNDIADEFPRVGDAIRAIGTDVAALLTSVSGKAALIHTHAIADVTGLQSALDGKSAVGHTHALGTLSDVTTTGASDHQVLMKIGSNWQPVTMDIAYVTGAVSVDLSAYYTKTQVDTKFSNAASVRTPTVFSSANSNLTAGQTSFALTYTPGFLDVFVNGVRQVLGDDFTATSGTAFVLATAVRSTDTVEAVAWSVINLTPLPAPLNSPAFTGNPTAPTPAPGDNDTSIPTTAWVQNEISVKAPLASPVFTGNPQAPTPSPGDNDTSIATTAFVANAVSGITSGKLIGHAYAETNAATTINSTIPDDNTIPQNTEGTLVLTATYTPVSTSNKLRITAVVRGSHSGNGAFWVLSAFTNASADALVVGGPTYLTGATTGVVSLLAELTPPSAGSALTFTVRMGSLSSSPGTFTMDRTTAGSTLGGVFKSELIIEEIAP